MSENVTIIPEPYLEFRYEQKMVDPHDGLAMFGPFDSDLPSAPKNISIGVIGTTNGMKSCREFLSCLNSPIIPDIDTPLWPPYPGFNACFNCAIPAEPTREHTIEDAAIYNAAFDLDPNRRTGSVVDLYIEGIKRILKFDDNFHVLICIIPDFVYQNCRPKSFVSKGIGERTTASKRGFRTMGQQNLFEKYDQDHYLYSTDFRRQIKARAMKYGVPIQIIRESSLFLGSLNESSRGMTQLSDRAWNLSVCLYYKSGGKPWKLANAREGVCYIGISYRLTGNSVGSRSACSAAQMFLDNGDGLVLMGEHGKWYSPEKKEFHLDKQAAKRLLSKVLDTYQQLEGKPLKEIFLHCRSSINREEFEGYTEACPQGVKIIGIRVRKERRDSIKLYREGKNAVLRGTLWKISNKSCFLWANGYKPRLGTYDGWETPIPIRIDIQHGESNIEQVANDIFSLTKLDYNSCKLGLSEPVTIGFSDSVGEILVSNPTIKDINPKFKFYI
jgi:hypothetical protein